MKKYAIIGFGGLGKTHFCNLLEIEKKRGDISLCAICNADLSAITESVALNIGSVSMDNVDFSKYNLYTDYKEMLDKEDLSFVLIALPTYLHASVTIECLKRGIDVYVEKPMALTLQDCEEMVKTAKENGRRLMVGHCLRFTDEYMFLKDCIEKGTYGKPVKAEFSRKSPNPGWSSGNWLLSEEKSGGCIVDMHVHDVDMMVWLFGAPDEIAAYSSHKMQKYESVYALYKYPDMTVSAICDWGIHPSYKFSATYAVTFENAYVELKDGVVTVYESEESHTVSFSGEDAMYREVETFIEGCLSGAEVSKANVNTVLDSMRVIFKEKELCK